MMEMAGHWDYDSESLDPVSIAKTQSRSSLSSTQHNTKVYYSLKQSFFLFFFFLLKVVQRVYLSQ